MNEWDKIASEWQRFRQRPMPELLPFLNRMKLELRELKQGRGEIGEKPKIFEAGCGTGRNLLFFEGLAALYGCDKSEEMLKRCPLTIESKRCSLPTLPYEDESFDAVLSIAVLHHLRRSEHKKAVDELLRVAAPRAPLLISVWNLQTELPKKEVTRKWGNVERYYYVFDEAEFFGLFKERCAPIGQNGLFVGRNLIVYCRKENV